MKLVSLAGGLVVCSLFFVSPARAQGSSASAEALFKAGQQLFAKGQIHEACEKFSESERAEPAIGTLLNLASCHERDGRTATAWGEYAAAASDAAKTRDKREKFAKDHAADLEKKLHYIVIDIDAPPAGIEVRFDGQTFGAGARGAPIPLDPGLHKMQVAAPGKTDWSMEVTISDQPGTDHIAVPVLADAPVDPPPPPPPTARPTGDVAPAPVLPDEGESSGSQRTVGFVVGGAGVVGIGVGAVFTILMAGKKSDRDQLCPAGVACASQSAFDQASSADSAARTDRAVAMVAFGAGAVAVGVGLALVLTSKPKPTKSGAVHVLPALGPRVAGVGLGGAF